MNDLLRASLAALALCIGAGCATAPAPSAPVAIDGIEVFDGATRLAEHVRPQAYRLALDLDPSAESFSGQVSIELALGKESRALALHAADAIDIRAARVEQDGETRRVRVLRGAREGITVVTDRPLAPGEATLHLRYEADFSETPDGLYRVREDGRWYAFTQFEPLEARQAFPCFDEPRFKTPFNVTINSPRGMLALTNSPVRQTEVDDTHTKYAFVESPKMPTYLVAFAVGDFDVVEAPETRMGPVDFRVITTRGKAALARFAIEASPPLLAAQEAYFGMRLPYRKLDFVGVPNFRYGAMENIGLVTYRDALLLLDGARAPAAARYRAQSVIAHELAHMWFGNYVTPTWWDELWLNESFATWMATRTLSEVAPELDAELDAVRAATRVMSSDALASARAIRQPIDTPGDVYDAFDGITYAKGAAVVRMVEAWAGEEAFRKGLRDYVRARAHGHGTTAQLLTALDAATGEPVGQVMRSFVDQPGTPLIEVAPSCEGGRLTLDLSQQRYLPAGSEASAEQTWTVPICVRYGRKGRGCHLLEAPRQTFEVELDACPAWIHPNAGERGYYHWSLPEEWLQELVKASQAHTNLSERVALLAHLEALTEAQALSYGHYLEAARALSAEPHRAVVSRVVDALEDVAAILDDPAPPGYDPRRMEDALRQWVQAAVGPHVDRLGAAPKAGEPERDKLLRPRVIATAARLGARSDLVDQGRSTVDAYLRAPEEVSVERLKLATTLAAPGGDEPLWERLRGALTRAPSPAARVALISALGRFEDPALLERSLATFLSDDLRAQDFWTLVGPSLRRAATARVSWGWTAANFDAIVDKLGEQAAADLPWVGVGFCARADHEAVDAFWRPRVETLDGASRNLARVLESIERCARFRDWARADAAAFLYDRAGLPRPAQPALEGEPDAQTP